MKMPRFVIALGILLGGMTAAHATNIGFGQLGGSNAGIPGNLASFATADGNGFVVSNGATPNIFLIWDSNWQVHRSPHFNPLENQFVGGGDWDRQGTDPNIGQLDYGNHSISFFADPGYAFVLNSFDFAHTAETAGTTQWDLTLTDSSFNVVWSESVTFDNGQVFTVSPNFTGLDGESYTLTFTRTFSSYNSDGRHGIDNLSFNQVAVPEPGVVGLLGVAGLALLLRRRK